MDLDLDLDSAIAGLDTSLTNSLLKYKLGILFYLSIMHKNVIIKAVFVFSNWLLEKQ